MRGSTWPQTGFAEKCVKRSEKATCLESRLCGHVTTGYSVSCPRFSPLYPHLPRNHHSADLGLIL